jgi:hypothetical protein
LRFPFTPIGVYQRDPRTAGIRFASKRRIINPAFHPQGDLADHVKRPADFRENCCGSGAAKRQLCRQLLVVEPNAHN